MKKSELHGIGASPGIAIGRAHVLHRRQAAGTGRSLANEAVVELEVEKYAVAVQRSLEELREIITGAEAAVAEIVEVQVEFLQDPQLEEAVLVKIREEKKTAEDAVQEAIGQWRQLFEHMEDEYLRARAADIEDIGQRILKNLGRENELIISVAEDGADDGADDGAGDIILVAPDIRPTDLIALDSKRIIGFATQIGGATSHAAIVARLRGLTAVVGCGEGLGRIRNGDRVILDGETGAVWVNPDAGILDGYEGKKAAHLETKERLKKLKNTAVMTTDGAAIQLLANIGGEEDLVKALECGATGVGLLRTELLFMQSPALPSEEEQFSFYKKILLRAAKRTVTIRTLDIGGDKTLPYLELPKEENPFLGYRAIRISLKQKDLFLTQVKAILRAGIFGPCRILLPMITNLQEVRQAKTLIGEAKAELSNRQLPFDPDIPVGVMIEVPSAALIADLLAKEVEFFSIGTNDLCQYVLAVDRMNEEIKALYDPFHPAVLRLIREVIAQGHRHGIPVGMCGEMAGDPQATLLLLGMGLEEFSMNAPSIPAIKHIILDTSLAHARAICDQKMSSL